MILGKSGVAEFRIKARLPFHFVVILVSSFQKNHGRTVRLCKRFKFLHCLGSKSASLIFRCDFNVVKESDGKSEFLNRELNLVASQVLFTYLH